MGVTGGSDYLPPSGMWYMVASYFASQFYKKKMDFLLVLSLMVIENKLFKDLFK